MKTKFWIICLSVFFVSCLRNMHDIYTGGEEEEEEKINKDDFFDFTTVRNSQLIIDYGMKVQTAFYLYDEYPMELVGNTWEFKDNKLWIATELNGIMILDLRQNQFLLPEQIHFESIREGDDNYSLSNASIRYVFQDSFNNIWIGTWG